MTWVIGLQSLGCASIFGDVRASYGHVEATAFGIQKIHRLNDRTAVGFAGSAKIGFNEVARLQDWASVVGGSAEVPEFLQAWYSDAHDTYELRYSSEDREEGCDLIFIGSSAQKLRSPDGREYIRSDPALGTVQLTHGYEVRFPSPGDPGSAPSLMGNFGAAVGVGAAVNEYVASARENMLPAMLNLGDIGSAAQSAEVIHLLMSAALNAVVERVPTPGVAPMFTGAVFNGDAVFFNSSDHGALGSGPLPPMAASYGELVQLQRDFGVPVAGATAVA